MPESSQEFQLTLTAVDAASEPIRAVQQALERLGQTQLGGLEQTLRGLAPALDSIASSVTTQIAALEHLGQSFDALDARMSATSDVVKTAMAAQTAEVVGQTAVQRAALAQHAQATQTIVQAGQQTQTAVTAAGTQERTQEVRTGALAQLDAVREAMTKQAQAVQQGFEVQKRLAQTEGVDIRRITEQTLEDLSEAVYSGEIGTAEILEEFNQRVATLYQQRGRATLAAQQEADAKILEAVRTELATENDLLRTALNEQVALREQAGTRAAQAAAAGAGGAASSAAGRPERAEGGGLLEGGLLGSTVEVGKQFLLWGTIFGLYSRGIELVNQATRGLISQNVAYEELQATMTAVYGGSGPGQAALDWLDKFAETTPFTREEVRQAGVAFAAAGDNIAQAVPAAGNLSAAMHNVGGIMGATQAIVDAQNNNFRMLRDQLHVTTPELEQYGLKMGDHGRVISSTVLPAIEKLVATKWGDAMALQMQTLGGAFSNLIDMAQHLQEVAGKGAFDALKGFLVPIVESFNLTTKDSKGQMQANLQSSLPVLEDFARRAGTMLGQALKAGLQGLEDWFTRIGGLPGLLNMVTQAWDAFAAALRTAFAVVQGVGDALGVVWKVVSTVGGAIAAVTEALAGLLGGGKNAEDGLRRLAEAVTLLIVGLKSWGLLGDLQQAAQARLATATEGLTGALQGQSAAQAQAAATARDLAEANAAVAGSAVAAGEASEAEQAALTIAQAQAFRAANWGAPLPNEEEVARAISVQSYVPSLPSVMPSPTRAQVRSEPEIMAWSQPPPGAAVPGGGAYAPGQMLSSEEITQMAANATLTGSALERLGGAAGSLGGEVKDLASSGFARLATAAGGLYGSFINAGGGLLIFMGALTAVSAAIDGLAKASKTLSGQDIAAQNIPLAQALLPGQGRTQQATGYAAEPFGLPSTSRDRYAQAAPTPADLQYGASLWRGGPMTPAYWAFSRMVGDPSKPGSGDPSYWLKMIQSPAFQRTPDFARYQALIQGEGRGPQLEAIIQGTSPLLPATPQRAYNTAIAQVQADADKKHKELWSYVQQDIVAAGQAYKDLLINVQHVDVKTATDRAQALTNRLTKQYQAQISYVPPAQPQPFSAVFQEQFTGTQTDLATDLAKNAPFASVQRDYGRIRAVGQRAVDDGLMDAQTLWTTLHQAMQQISQQLGQKLQWDESLGMPSTVVHQDIADWATKLRALHASNQEIAQAVVPAELQADAAETGQLVLESPKQVKKYFSDLKARLATEGLSGAQAAAAYAQVYDDYAKAKIQATQQILDADVTLGRTQDALTQMNAHVALLRQQKTPQVEIDAYIKQTTQQIYGPAVQSDQERLQYVQTMHSSWSQTMAVIDQMAQDARRAHESQQQIALQTGQAIQTAADSFISDALLLHAPLSTLDSIIDQAAQQLLKHGWSPQAVAAWTTAEQQRAAQPYLQADVTAQQNAYTLALQNSTVALDQVPGYVNRIMTAQAALPLAPGETPADRALANQIQRQGFLRQGYQQVETRETQTLTWDITRGAPEATVLADQARIVQTWHALGESSEQIAQSQRQMTDSYYNSRVQQDQQVLQYDEAIQAPWSRILSDITGMADDARKAHETQAQILLQTTQTLQSAAQSAVTISQQLHEAPSQQLDIINRAADAMARAGVPARVVRAYRTSETERIMSPVYGQEATSAQTAFGLAQQQGQIRTPADVTRWANTLTAAQRQMPLAQGETQGERMIALQAQHNQYLQQGFQVLDSNDQKQFQYDSNVAAPRLATLQADTNKRIADLTAEYKAGTITKQDYLLGVQGARRDLANVFGNQAVGAPPAAQYGRVSPFAMGAGYGSSLAFYGAGAGTRDPNAGVIAELRRVAAYWESRAHHDEQLLAEAKATSQNTRRTADATRILVDKFGNPLPPLGPTMSAGARIKSGGGFLPKSHP